MHGVGGLRGGNPLRAATRSELPGRYRSGWRQTKCRLFQIRAICPARRVYPVKRGISAGRKQTVGVVACRTKRGPMPNQAVASILRGSGGQGAVGHKTGAEPAVVALNDAVAQIFEGVGGNGAEFICGWTFGYESPCTGGFVEIKDGNPQRIKGGRREHGPEPIRYTFGIWGKAPGCYIAFPGIGHTSIWLDSETFGLILPLQCRDEGARHGRRRFPGIGSGSGDRQSSEDEHKNERHQCGTRKSHDMGRTGIGTQNGFHDCPVLEFLVQKTGWTGWNAHSGSKHCGGRDSV